MAMHFTIVPLICISYIYGNKICETMMYQGLLYYLVVQQIQKVIAILYANFCCPYVI